MLLKFPISALTLSSILQICKLRLKDVNSFHFLSHILLSVTVRIRTHFFETSKPLVLLYLVEFMKVPWKCSLGELMVGHVYGSSKCGHAIPRD